MGDDSLFGNGVHQLLFTVCYEFGRPHRPFEEYSTVGQRLPFEVSYKFNWYYLTRIEFIYRAEGKAEEAAKAVEALEQMEQLYDSQFELPFYKRRAYIRNRSREALRMGVYSEMLYFVDAIGRKMIFIPG